MKIRNIGIMVAACALCGGEWSDAAAAPEPAQEKWSQTPDMAHLYGRESYRAHYNGEEGEKQVNSVIANAWFSGDDKPVTSVRWWGAYIFYKRDVQGFDSPPSARPSSVSLSLYRNQEGVDIPGYKLQSVELPMAQVRETYYGDYKAPDDGEGNAYIHVFQYDCNLSEPWEQQSGETCWLGIQMIYDTDTEYEWAWITTNPADGFAPAVIRDLNQAYPVWNTMNYADDHEYPSATKLSNAFALFTSPVWINVLPTTFTAQVPTYVTITVNVQPFPEGFRAYIVAFLPDGSLVSFVPQHRAEEIEKRQAGLKFPTVPVSGLHPATASPAGFVGGVNVTIFEGVVRLSPGEYTIKTGFFYLDRPVTSENDAFLLGSTTVVVE